MRVLCLFALVALAAAGKELMKETPFSQDELRALFTEFKAEHNKEYKTDAEDEKRFNIFAGHVEFIRAHNLRERDGFETYRTGLNELCDLSHSEYRQKYLSPLKRERDLDVVTLDASAAPTSVDWRSKGAVTPVKNQGQCGSCWSFSTTGSVEGRSQILTGKLNSLSEQQLMDCSKPEGDQSCNGGLMDYAFEYIEKNGGIDSESDYPYKARNEMCKKSKESEHVASISSHKDVEKGSEDQLKAAVAEGPVSIAIEADQRGFQTYSSGVFSGPCGQNLDHGVLAVGYGEQGSEGYWIVKNSWGSSWGDHGYIKLVMGRNQCGLANAASYPIASQPSTAETSNESVLGNLVLATPNEDDYEDPKPNGCHSDETPVRINGVSGDYCAPSCNGQGSSCPPVPDGATAQGQCVVEKPGSSGPTLCAMICQPGANAACPGTSTCKPIQGVGICTYDD